MRFPSRAGWSCLAMAVYYASGPCRPLRPGLRTARCRAVLRTCLIEVVGFHAAMRRSKPIC